MNHNIINFYKTILYLYKRVPPHEKYMNQRDNKIIITTYYHDSWGKYCKVVDYYSIVDGSIIYIKSTDNMDN